MVTDEIYLFWKPWHILPVERWDEDVDVGVIVVDVGVVVTVVDDAVVVVQASIS
jgi:hypothetical protein